MINGTPYNIKKSKILKKNSHSNKRWIKFIVVSDNSLSPAWWKAIIWINADLTRSKFLTNFKTHTKKILSINAFQNAVWKMSAILSQPQWVTIWIMNHPRIDLDHGFSPIMQDSNVIYEYVNYTINDIHESYTLFPFMPRTKNPIQFISYDEWKSVFEWKINVLMSIQILVWKVAAILLIWHRLMFFFAKQILLGFSLIIYETEPHIFLSKWTFTRNRSHEKHNEFIKVITISVFHLKTRLTINSLLHAPAIINSKTSAEIATRKAILSSRNVPNLKALVWEPRSGKPTAFWSLCTYSMRAIVLSKFKRNFFWGISSFDGLV